MLVERLQLPIEVKIEPRHSGLLRWQYLPVALIALYALAKSPSVYTVYAISVTALVMLVMGLRRPAFIAAAIILVELTISAIEVPFGGTTLNVRYLVIWLGIGIVAVRFPMSGQSWRLGPGIVPFLLLGGVFVNLIILSTSIGLAPELTASVSRYFGTGLAAMLLIPLMINDKDDLKLVAITALVALTLSAIAAISQNFPQLPSLAITGNGKAQGRVLGLTSSPIQLAGSLTMATLLVWGVATVRTLKVAPRVLFLMIVVVTSIGWYYSFTRSALYGAVLGILVMVPFLKGRMRVEIAVALAIFLILGGLWLQGKENRFTVGVRDDKSASTRLPLWQIGYFIALDNPLLGIGSGSFQRLAPDYVNRLQLSDATIKLNVVGSVSLTPVHNDFLRVWLSYGTPALTVYLMMLMLTGFNFLWAYRRAKEPWLEGIALGCFGALVGYLVNSALHNTMDSTIVLWILIGWSVALLKVTASRPALRKTVRSRTGVSPSVL